MMRVCVVTVLLAGLLTGCGGGGGPNGAAGSSSLLPCGPLDMEAGESATYGFSEQGRAVTLVTIDVLSSSARAFEVQVIQDGLARVYLLPKSCDDPEILPPILTVEANHVLYGVGWPGAIHAGDSEYLRPTPPSPETEVGCTAQTLDTSAGIFDVQRCERTLPPVEFRIDEITTVTAYWSDTQPGTPAKPLRGLLKEEVQYRAVQPSVMELLSWNGV